MLTWTFPDIPFIMRIKPYLIIVLMIAVISCQNENSRLGDEYFEAGKYEKAIEAYNEFLKLNPRHVKTIYNRGRCYEELGKKDEALADFNTVIDLDANNENALLSLGQVFYRKGDFKSSIFYGEKVLERDPNNAMAFYLIGRAYHRQGMTRDAMRNYNSAINLTPNFGEAYLHRGALKLILRQNKAACVDLNKAAELNTEGADKALKKNCR